MPARCVKIKPKNKRINPDMYNLSKQKPLIIIYPDTSITVIENGAVDIEPETLWETGVITKINIHIHDPKGLAFTSGGYKRYRQYKEQERRKKLKQKAQQKGANK